MVQDLLVGRMNRLGGTLGSTPQLRSLKLEGPNHDSDDENLSENRNKEDE